MGQDYGKEDKARLAEQLEAQPLPEEAIVMLNTRMVNRFLGTSYSVEEVAGWDLQALAMIQGLEGGFGMLRDSARPGPGAGRQLPKGL